MEEMGDQILFEAQMTGAFRRKSFLDETPQCLDRHGFQFGLTIVVIITDRISIIHDCRCYFGGCRGRVGDR
eukprot:scaffold187203_cov41-Attheya_sp.AAC.1